MRKATTVAQRISVEWLQMAIWRISQGKSTLAQETRQAILVGSPQPVRVLKVQFRKACQIHGIKVTFRRGRPAVAVQQPEIENFVMYYRHLGVVVGIEKMYYMLRSAGVATTVQAVTEIYRRHGLAQEAVARKPEVQRCRYEAERPNDVWHVDVHYWSAMKGLYVYAAIDDFSRYCVGLDFMASKDAAAVSSLLTRYIAECGAPGVVWSDNGLENTASRTTETLRQHGVTPITTEPYTPQQNGKVERFWRELEKMVRTIDDLGRFRENYNRLIPHSAIGFATPASRYFSVPKYRPGDDVYIVITEHGTTRRRLLNPRPAVQVKEESTQ